MRGKSYILIMLAIFTLLSLNVSSTDFTTCSEINTSGTHTISTAVSSVNSCFNITASDMSLDCQGNTINFNTANVSIAAAINISNARNITIKNCILKNAQTLTGSNYGVFMQGVNDSLITNNTFTVNRSISYTGIYAINSTKLNVTNNTINSTIAIVTNFYGLYLVGGTSNVLILDNIINSTFSLNNYGVLNNGVGSSNYTISNNNFAVLGFSLVNYGMNFGNVLNNSGYHITNNIIRVSGTGSSMAIVISLFDNVYVENNTLNVSSTSLNFVYGFFNGALSNVTYKNNFVTVTAKNAAGFYAYPNSVANVSNLTIYSSNHWIDSASNLTTNFTNITFMTEKGNINLFGHFNYSSPVDAEHIYLNQSHLNITQNKAYINTSNSPFLNMSGTVTLNNITLSNPFPYMDFDDDGVYEQCFGICSIVSYVGNVFIFNVAHFTSYAAQADPGSTGPVETSDVGGGGNFDERYTSLQGIYEAQFGRKPVIGGTPTVGETPITDPIEKGTFQKPILDENVESGSKIELESASIEKEMGAEIEPVVRKRNLRIQYFLFFFILLIIVLLLVFFYIRRKRD